MICFSYWMFVDPQAIAVNRNTRLMSNKFKHEYEYSNLTVPKYIITQASGRCILLSCQSIQHKMDECQRNRPVGISDNPQDYTIPRSVGIHIRRITKTRI